MLILVQCLVDILKLFLNNFIISLLLLEDVKKLEDLGPNFGHKKLPNNLLSNFRENILTTFFPLAIASKPKVESVKTTFSNLSTIS